MRFCRTNVKSSWGTSCQTVQNLGLCARRGLPPCSAMHSLLGRRARAAWQKHATVRVVGRKKRKMWSIYRRIVFQCSAQGVLSKNDEIQTYLKQPVSPYPACLFCVFKHRLKDVVFITAAVQHEGQSMFKKCFQPRKTRQDKRYEGTMDGKK